MVSSVNMTIQYVMLLTCLAVGFFNQEEFLT